MDEAEEIARQMAAYPINPDVQLAQTRFRLQLVEGWKIPKGSRVLEIGCGQGEMTVVLAHAVGSEGHVTALDAASRDYGGPVCVGESADHLSQTPLGRRVEFHFEYDLLDAANDFPPDAFDYVVFAHCSWYFGSIDQFRRTLLHVRSWAKHLCYSEWDLEPRSLDQVAHLLAVLVQGQVEAYRLASEANVRTPFSRTKLEGLLRETGWTPTLNTTIDSGRLQDAGWEIDRTLICSLAEAKVLDLPPKLQEFLESQALVLSLLAEKHKNRSLSSCSIVALRTPEFKLPGHGNRDRRDDETRQEVGINPDDPSH
jgi:SAM-dependent methyltransferase